MLSVFHDVVLINYLIPSLFSDELATVILMALESIRYICYGFVTNMLGFFSIMVFFSITSIYQISLKSIVYKASKERPQGNVQGALGSIRTLALGSGSMFYSAIYSYSLEKGRQYAYVAFLTAAVVVMIGFIYTLRLFFTNEHFTPCEEPIEGIPSLNGSNMVIDRLLSGNKGRFRSNTSSSASKDGNGFENKENKVIL